LKKLIANGYFRDADSNRTELDWGDEHKPEVLTEPQKQALKRAESAH